MSTNLERLKQVLAEIFQLDQPELDFGMYRIMNAKREEINPVPRPGSSTPGT